MVYNKLVGNKKTQVHKFRLLNIRVTSLRYIRVKFQRLPKSLNPNAPDSRHPSLISHSRHFEIDFYILKIMKIIPFILEFIPGNFLETLAD